MQTKANLFSGQYSLKQLGVVCACCHLQGDNLDQKIDDDLIMLIITVLMTLSVFKSVEQEKGHNPFKIMNFSKGFCGFPVSRYF